MINFAHTLDAVAVVFKMLGKRHDVRQRGAEVGNEIPNLGVIGASASEQTGARGRADGLLAIRAVEGDALFRDAVEVRALHVVRAISAELGADVEDRTLATWVDLTKDDRVGTCAEIDALDVVVSLEMKQRK